MGGTDGLLDTATQALDSVQELAVEPVAAPEFSHETSQALAESLSDNAELDSKQGLHEVNTADSNDLGLHQTNLDRTVENLAGSQPGLQATEAEASQTPWDAQLVLQGTSSGENHVTGGNPDSPSNGEATAPDAFGKFEADQESSGINATSYEHHRSDSLSGLYVSDSPDRLPLVANNLPPLIAEDFKNDDLLVYKNYGGVQTDFPPQVDLLKDVDVLSLSENNDVLHLNSGPTSPQIDFSGGVDLAKISSSGDQPDVTPYKGLEHLEWTSLDSDGQPRGLEPIHFNVLEWQEDATSMLPVGEYRPTTSAESTETEPWILKSFALPGAAPKPLPDWLELQELPPTPELVGQGRVVINHSIVTDADDESLLWLEVFVHDLRPEGQGLVGLELDLDWNATALELRDDLLKTDEVFNQDHLPLFQSLGERSSIGGRESLTGLGAAALPRANQGLALGLNEESGGQSLFARLGFRRQNAQAAVDLRLSPTLTPPAGGMSLATDELLVLDDFSPSVWVVRAIPDQQQVGSHSFTLSRSNGANVELQHFAIAVREVNDAPQAVDVAPEALKSVLQQDTQLVKALSPLFSDQDDASLTFSLLDAPAWLQLDAANGVLTALPGNAQVGEHSINVQASDDRGGLASQTLRISVSNVNDRPVIGPVALQPPDLQQGERFTYRIPNGMFSDPDLLVDPEEQLTFSLEPAEGGDQTLPSWVKLDLSTGTLSGIAGPADVGDNRFIVRATDNQGLFVDQTVVLNVANVNDAPHRTSALNAFLALQHPATEGTDPPSEDNPLALFSGLERKIDLKPWFTDPDLGVNQNENLTLVLELDTGTGSLIELNDPVAAPEWLRWNPDSGLLTVSPSAEQIGEHFLRIRATDADDLTASALVPLLVRHRNSAPFQQINSLDALISASQLDGVISTQPQLIGDQLIGLEFDLAEDSDINIELPTNLFGDRDLSIDLAERLTYSLIADQELPFNFDPTSLSLHGSTEELALTAPNGHASWTAQLIVADAAGETASFDLKLMLQRSAAVPVLTTTATTSWDEGSSVPLLDLLDLRLSARPGDVLELLLEQSEGQPLKLHDTLNQDIISQSEGKWLLSGTAEQLETQLAHLNLQPDDPHAIGEFALSATATSELGSTGLRSEAITARIDFKLDPVATAPRWSERPALGTVDAFALNTFANFLAAELIDPRESLVYEVELPDQKSELLITNRAGDALGSREGNRVLLTASQWAEAMLRSDSADLLPVELGVRALSSEPSTGRQATSSTHHITWQPTPLLRDTDAPQAVLITPSGVQRSSEASSMSLALSWPEAARSGQILIDVPLGSDVVLDGFTAEKLDVADHPQSQRFVFTLLSNADQPLPTELKLKVSSPETSSETLFTGSVQLLSSARSILPPGGLSEAVLKEDRAISLATKPLHHSFSWEVAQVAKTPEFGPDTDLRFNPNTGELQIDLRRGESKSGFRNPAETLTLTIGNIPEGYTLAERFNGAYRPVGATDAFGTMTLFSLPAQGESATPETMATFQRLNNLNGLFLVSTEKDPEKRPPELDATQSLSLSITAGISDQPGGDSRSAAATSTISLESFKGKVPRISQTVDPLILDLGGVGLPLTSLDQSVNFSMLPGSNPMPTAWLKQTANTTDQRSAALLVLNDSSNDAPGGDVTISSITELLSEYFQAEGKQRSFSSGSEALVSLNSNGDQVLDAADQAWNQLKLWFDDGDAISETGELVSIGEVLTSIDLGSLETLSDQPNWAAGNAVLRRLSGVDLDKSSGLLHLYDIGLQVAPGGDASLPLRVTGPVHLKEGGQHTTVRLLSEGSENWEEGQDELTLVRLSGLPDELLPSLGVKDSRGDWLFTWADLKTNNGNLEIFTNSDWSGGSNLQILLSQLQNDGTLLSSPLASLAVDVEAIADAPVLQVNTGTIREDTPLALSSLLARADITDNDGSESISYELHGLPAGALIQQQKNGVVSVIEPSESGVFKIDPADLDTLSFVPPSDRDGQLSFQWHALSHEQSNGSTATTIANVLINVRAVSDTPLNLELAPTPPALVEGKKLAIADLVLQPLATTGLTDTDGSEQLRLEFSLPNGLSLQSLDPEWVPLSAQTLANGNQVIVIDVPNTDEPDHWTNLWRDLRLVDQGVRQEGLAPTTLQLGVTRISREINSGDQVRSTTQLLNLAFDRDARAAKVTLPEVAPSGMEDDGGVALSDLLQAEATESGDVLTYRISGIADGVNLVDTDGAVQVVPPDTPLTLATLEGWHLEAFEHRAGTYTVDLQVLSTPPGQGAAGTSAVHRLQFEITPVADTPELTFGATPTEKLTIASNGWLNLSDLKFLLSTGDGDGSERLSIAIAAADAKGDPQPLPSQAKFNLPGSQDDAGRLIIQQADLAEASLYLGEIADDLRLLLTPHSIDGDSEAIGEAKLVEVAANAVVRVPLLEVRGVLEGFEDQPIPLLSHLEGVIDAQLRGNGAGQSLELELTELPKNSMLVRAQSGDANQLVPPFTPALNRNNAGELVTSLRLPYAQWQNVYWQGAKDQEGTFTFEVQAFSVGNNGKTLSSDRNEVQVVLTPVNDAPRLRKQSDLEAIDEGATGSWNLRSRFEDVDNDAGVLVIKAKQVGPEGDTVELPSWLSLDSEGVLAGTPSNTDVGVLRLLITAEDPLGQLTSQSVSLTVGDINASPIFNSQALQGWTAENQDGMTTYLRTLDLRQMVQIDLNVAFSDEDLVNNDQLSYSISRDGLTWGEEITGLAQIDNKTLTIQPEGKETVGIQALKLRVTDLQGASDIQDLRLIVRNINDTPVVTRQNAALLRAGVWQETIQVNQEQKEWALNLEGLFKDADAGDRIDQIVPNSLPAWLTYTASPNNSGGVLSGTPGNEDVGLQTLEWQALDNAGATATYRLRLDVRNINDAPQLRANPDLSELGLLINGSPSLDQDAQGRLDLNELFLDPDNIHGDALRYSIKALSKDGELLKTNPDWLKLSLEQAVAPDASGKLLMEPVLHRIEVDGSTGARLAPGEINQLTSGTVLRVVVEATDDRDVKLKGLVGLDLDVSWSSALNLMPDSTQISTDLPLFNQLTIGPSSLRIVAGSTPDIGKTTGAPVGDQAKETLLTFDVQVNDPSQRLVIGLSTGQGDERDGLLDRYAQNLDPSNSVIHSFASKIYLEALRPKNDDVGRYEVVLEAEDLTGERVSKMLSLVVANRNDAPLIDAQGTKQADLLVQWLANEHLEGNRSTEAFRLFTDPDLPFKDSLSYQLLPGADNQETETWLLPDSIVLEQSDDGSISLDLIPPRGLTAVIDQQFKLKALDEAGLSVSSDWFTVAFRPLAEPTLLTRGESAKPLEAIQLGGATTKNSTLDLQSVLNVNALTLADPDGDEVIIKLLVKQPDAELNLRGETDIEPAEYEFLERENVAEGVLFSIDMQTMTKNTENPTNSLDGLHLTLPPNQFELLPRSLSPGMKTGISIQMWTETRVKGDIDGNFNVALTDPITIWAPIDNVRPIFKPQNIITKLDNSFFNAIESQSLSSNTSLTPDQLLASSSNELQTSSRNLANMSELFEDVDSSETLAWELDIPKTLEGMIELNNATGEIQLSAGIRAVSDLPTGVHRLIVRAKDSSGQLGDASGVATGSIRLLVAAPEEAPATARGLSHLTQLNAKSMNELFTKKAEDRSEEERQAFTILEKMNIKEDELDAFSQKLEQGSLAVLSNENEDQPMLLIDTSQNPDSILMDTAMEQPADQQVITSGELLEDREIVDAPLGEIEFTVDTQGRDFSVVQLKMQDGGVEMDTLFKTDASGNPLIFQSEILSHSEDDGPVDQWLANLEYDLYYYDPKNSQSDQEAPIISLSADENSLAEILLTNNPLFNIDDIKAIDGSAYLIDLDSNGTIDLVSMLLVDQGWFDTRQDALGLIGDPLMPVATAAKALISQNINAGLFLPSVSDTTVPAEMPVSDIADPEIPPSVPNQPQTVPTEETIPSERNTKSSPTITTEDTSSQPNPKQQNTSREEQTNQTSTERGGDARGLIETKPISGEASSRESATLKSPIIDVDNTSRSPLLGNNSVLSSSQPGDENSSLISESSMNTNNSSGLGSYANRFLNDLQGWMNSKREQATDALRSVFSPLDTASETPIAAAVGMILLPLLTERSFSLTAKGMDRDITMKLLRRDPNFSGKWLIFSRKGSALMIKREKGELTVEQHEIRANEAGLTCLPGFDKDGHSLMSKAVGLSRNPGEFIKSLDAMRIQLLKTQTQDINWQSWIEKHFDANKTTTAANQEAKNALAELKILMAKAMSNNLALADVVMMSQIIDCASSFGLCSQAGEEVERLPNQYQTKKPATIKEINSFRKSKETYRQKAS